MENKDYMYRCMQLALLGKGMVSPNPMVGCVIVHEDNIIGEGWHEKYGEAHAEVNAVKNVLETYGEEDGRLRLKEATVYVNLEPCSHYGKTPPCANMLVRYGVKRVVIANKDISTKVSGTGINILQQAGITVKSGVLAKEGEELNRRFFCIEKDKRPYVILKWAETADGRMAMPDLSQRWISNDLSKQLVHKWRSEEDAILVGKNTFANDKPLLTNRLWPGKNPLRIYIDKRGNVEYDYLLDDDGPKTIILTERPGSLQNNVAIIQMEDMQHYLPQKILYQLYLMNIQSIIVEGGAGLLNSFINENLWDEARVFISKARWNEGLYAPNIYAADKYEQTIGDNTLITYRNTKAH